MMHPHSRLEFISKEIGYGVIATRRIPKGTITYALDALELIITDQQFKQIQPELQKQVEWYSYRDELNRRVLSWDIAKYVNHSCNYNTLTTGWGFEIAVRDIECGEEITDDYGLFMAENETMDLRCGEPDCRGRVSGQDKDVLGKSWDRKIQKALACFHEVEQPLMNLLAEETQMDLLAYLQGQKLYRSVATSKTPA